jgi:hypothetical protein
LCWLYHKSGRGQAKRSSRFDDSNTVTVSYVLGNGRLISQTRAGATGYHLAEAQGNVPELTEANGAILDEAFLVFIVFLRCWAILKPNDRPDGGASPRLIRDRRATPGEWRYACIGRRG